MFLEDVLEPSLPNVVSKHRPLVRGPHQPTGLLILGLERHDPKRALAKGPLKTSAQCMPA